MAATLGYFLSFSIREYIEHQIEEQLRSQSALAVAYVQTGGKNRSFNEIADELGKLLNLRVTFMDYAGRVLGDSDPKLAGLSATENQFALPEVVEAIQRGTGAAIRYTATARMEFIYVARRSNDYVVRLALPLSVVDALVSQLLLRLAFAVLIASGITLIFGYLIRGLISSPLQEMAVAARKLAAGDLQQRLPISGEEEIAALGNSLNTMADNLNARMQELSEDKQRLELIVSAMSEGVMVLDSAGRIALTNRSVRNVLETDRNLIGKTPFDVLRRPEIDNVVRKVLAGGPAEMVELATGSGRILQANVAPVANASRVVDAVVIVFHDLTSIRRMERMRRDFVANVSHEFKTPLTSIRGYAETLLSGALADRKTAPDFVRTIERNAEHLEALVSDLLTLARIEAELPATKETVDIKVIVDEQISCRHSVLAARGIRVLGECQASRIQADRGRLSMAISNLIDNAILYNKPGGEIRITSACQNGTFRLDISDTGEGIAAHELSRIFERFYRVDKARSRESGGTGLGLSIVKHAIESQGGTVSVSSKLGAGSTFTLRVPV
jgi:two-component system phosphate regulon sensor histidine kinase PhoR